MYRLNQTFSASFHSILSNARWLFHFSQSRSWCLPSKSTLQLCVGSCTSPHAAVCVGEGQPCSSAFLRLLPSAPMCPDWEELACGSMHLLGAAPSRQLSMAVGKSSCLHFFHFSHAMWAETTAQLPHCLTPWDKRGFLPRVLCRDLHSQTIFCEVVPSDVVGSPWCSQASFPTIRVVWCLSLLLTALEASKASLSPLQSPGGAGAQLPALLSLSLPSPAANGYCWLWNKRKAGSIEQAIDAKIKDEANKTQLEREQFKASSRCFLFPTL